MRIEENDDGTVNLVTGGAYDNFVRECMRQDRDRLRWVERVARFVPFLGGVVEYMRNDLSEKESYCRAIGVDPYGENPGAG